MADGYVLLRLTPGPAEQLFGITAAPMVSVADGYGRMIAENLPVRGTIPAACATLEKTLAGFDATEAAKPPPPIPDWAEALLLPDGKKAMSRLLAAAGKRGRPTVADLADLYGKLPVERQRIAFCESYLGAEATRRELSEDEVALLMRMTRDGNDHLKFRAIEGLGRVLPVARISFLVERAKDRARGSRNPNVVLCRCVAAIGSVAARLGPRAEAEAREAVLGTLPFLREVLETEGRNNSACLLASNSILAILDATASLDALQAYFENFRSPRVNNDWMRDRTAKYHERALVWLRKATGRDLGPDPDAWKSWLDENRGRLRWDPRAGRLRRR